MELRKWKAEAKSRRLELKGWRTRVMQLDRRAMVEPEDWRTKIELGVWKPNAEPQRGRTMMELEGWRTPVEPKEWRAQPHVPKSVLETRR